MSLLARPAAVTSGEGGSAPVADEQRARPATGRGAGFFARIMFVIGSVGLLAAMTVETVAVIGRHTGLSLLGSIEVVQAAIVLIASASVVLATLDAGHASVHIVTERLPVAAAAKLARVANLLSALLFLLIVAGSAWVAADLWHGFEKTELLGLPLRWLRALWIGSATLAALLFLAAAFRKKSR